MSGGAARMGARRSTRREYEVMDEPHRCFTYNGHEKNKLN